MDVRSTGVGGLLSLQNGNLRCYTLLCEDLFPKERDKYKVSLMNGSSLILTRTQRKIVPLKVLTVSP